MRIEKLPARLIKTLFKVVSAGKKASVTVEASIALPLYIFFFVNVLTAFDILRMQGDLTAALHQSGNQICAKAFDIKYAASLAGGEDGELTDIGTGLLSVAHAQSSVLNYLGDDYLSGSVVEGGAGGLSFLQSKVMLCADEVDLIVSYHVKPFFPGIVPFKSYQTHARYFGHAWTGYEPGGAGLAQTSEDDPIVYVTENGTVYHRNINCRYLRPAVRQTSIPAAQSALNNAGERYTPCEICGSYSNGRGTVYVTDGGNRIHSTITCSGLKRTIFTMHLSEVGGKPPCSVCGGSH